MDKNYYNSNYSPVHTKSLTLARRLADLLEDQDIGKVSSLLQNYHANPNVIIPDKGVSPFHLAIGATSEIFAKQVTKLFLRFGGDPNLRSTFGFTPLHIAAAWGRTSVLHLLLLNGGDPWIQDNDRKTCFNYAFEEQKWEVVEMLHHFQLMHSSQKAKFTPTVQPTYDLERIWIANKNNVLVEYIPVEKIKSVDTENDYMRSKYFKNYSPIKTDSDSSKDVNSPVQRESISPVHEIKQFFENSILEESKKQTWIIPKESSPEFPKTWNKDIFQSSCKVIIHEEKSPIEQIEEVKENCVKPNVKKRLELDFLKLDCSPLTKTNSLPLPKNSNSDTGDLRSKLFVELNEAFKARSKINLTETETCDNTSSLPCVSTRFDILNQAEIHYVNELSGIHLNNTSQLPNIKNEDTFQSIEVHPGTINISPNITDDLSSIVDNELKSIITEDSFSSLEKKGNLHSTNLTNSSVNDVSVEILSTSNVDKGFPGSTYVSCDSKMMESESFLKKVETMFVPELTNDNSPKLTSGAANINETNNSVTDQFLSVCEEYRYTDHEEGVVLLEEKHVVTPSVSKQEEDKRSSRFSLCSVKTGSSLSSVPSSFAYDTDSLRVELVDNGCQPGPIMKTTKKLYLRKLYRIKKQQGSRKLYNISEQTSFCAELEKTLRTQKNFDDTVLLSTLEDEMCNSFSNPTRRWREGTCKTSFNYLLLDPRKTQNLPKRFSSMSMLDVWKIFLSAIFYIGKGKRSRPFAHLYEAVSSRKADHKKINNKKVQCILEIWDQNLGVVFLHVFNNVMPVEAYTREAAMIDAISRQNLKNLRLGDYYGIVSSWTIKQKQKLGVYLLYRAMLVFLNEGERQIKPGDIE